MQKYEDDIQKAKNQATANAINRQTIDLNHIEFQEKSSNPMAQSMKAGGPSKVATIGQGLDGTPSPEPNSGKKRNNRMSMAFNMQTQSRLAQTTRKMTIEPK